MEVQEYYNQEMNEKPSVESCFKNTIGITYAGNEIQNEEIHSKDEMLAFAKAYHELKVKNLALSGVTKHYYHEVCGKGTLVKEYEHSVYGTMLMVKPLKQKDIYIAPKKEFTELPFS